MLIDRIEHDVHELLTEVLPEGDRERVDLAGRLNKLSQDLARHKRLILAEVDGPVRGEHYQQAVSNKYDRSYSTAAILHDFADAGWTIRDLLDRKAVTLAWRWTELKAAMYEADVTLRVAPREIEDDGDIDGPHVGETRQSEASLKGLTF